MDSLRSYTHPSKSLMELGKVSHPVQSHSVCGGCLLDISCLYIQSRGTCRQEWRGAKWGGGRRLSHVFSFQSISPLDPGGLPPAQAARSDSSLSQTQAWSLGWEDPLEEEMATHSSILAWKIPRTSRAWWATVHGVAVMTEWLSTHTPNNCHLPDTLFLLSSWKVMKGPSLSLIIPFVLKTILSHVKKSASVFMCFVFAWRIFSHLLYFHPLCLQI